MKALKVKDVTTRKSVISEAAASKPGNAFCSCAGTTHKPVSNCCACGFIICERVLLLAEHVQQIIPLEPMENIPEPPFLALVSEKLCLCPFCGANVYKVPPTSSLELYEVDSDTVRAYANKDKLLTFDQEHAKRTVVRDAQGDYYSSSAWLTEEEKKIIDAKEQKRMKRHFERKQRKYNIHFDIAGRKIIEAVSDDEEGEPEGTVDEETAGTADGYGQVSASIPGKEGQHRPGSTASEAQDLPVFANAELEEAMNDAGEVYRFIKQNFAKDKPARGSRGQPFQRVHHEFS